MAKAHVRDKHVFRRPLHTMDQPLLMPESLDEALEGEGLVLGLKRIVAGIPDSVLQDLYAPYGGVPYAPKSLLTVWLLGVIEGDCSERVLQKRCRFDIRFRYLCDGQRPDDRTLGRFFHRMRPALAELMAFVLDQARQSGLLGMRAVALDGTRVPGNVSQLRRALDRADSESSDPDARSMPSPQGFIRGYNAQMAMDADSRLVVASQVHPSSADSKRLPEMVDQAERLAGKPPDSWVADAGYDAATNLSHLDEHGVTSFVAPKDDALAGWTVSGDGRPVCPAGHPACRNGVQTRENGLRVVQWSVAKCPGCLLRESCGAGKVRRFTIPEGMRVGLRTENDARCRSPEGRTMMWLRRTTVEPFFGHLKWNLGMRRFSRRGLACVNGEFQLQCLAWNVRILAGRLLRRLKRVLYRLWTPFRTFWASWWATRNQLPLGRPNA